MAKNRLFNLPETKGSFEIRGKISGVEKDGFYKEGVSTTGNKWRRINFGVNYDEHATVFVGLNGSPREKVYFSKRNKEAKKPETKAVNWNDRNKFNEDGYRLIGIGCGLEQKRNEKGAIENVNKTLVEYDACEYMKDILEDDMDVFVRGDIDFRSYENDKGEIKRSVNYTPKSIYACKAPIDFDAEDFEPRHEFKQTIVFREITKEMEDDKETGRFVVSAWIVKYNSIENADFIIEDKSLANLFKKNLKEYTSIDVHGKINCRTIVETVTEEDCWGQRSEMDRVSHPVVREMIITGAIPASIDKSTYSEKEMNAAFEAIRKDKNAEENFGDSDTSAWGDDSGMGDGDDLPW